MGQCLRAVLRELVGDEQDGRSEEAKARDEAHATVGGLLIADHLVATKRLSNLMEAIARSLGGG